MEKDILLPEKKRKKVRKELEKRFLKFDREKYLKLGSLLDEEKNSIICPFCFNPSVKYLKKYEEWCCEYCGVEIKFPSIIHEINIEDKEMYKINTLWGIKALQKLTGKDLSFLYLKLYGEKYLDLGNFLDEEKNSLICPFCFNPSAKYIEKYKEWYCGHCDVEIKFESISFKLDIDNKEMYKIYKLWGIDALQKLTGKTIAALQKQVGKYFENCCSSRGDECLYISHIKEMKNDIKEKQKEIINSKRIETISSLFNIAKSNYESLYQRIEELSVLIEAYSNLFCVEEKFKVENEYKYLKSTVEQISNSLDDYLIVPANNYLKNDQKVYIEELDEILVAVSKPLKGLESIIEGFTWNAAKQGGLVGVFFVHYGFYEELNQRVLELEQQVKEQRLKWSFENLSFLEQEALKIIIVENGIFQNYLWRKLQIDSRKCSRIINRLLEENLIIREPAVSNGARSYFLKVND